MAGVQDTRTTTGQPEASGRLGQSVETFAEDLGRLLGTAERKATEWLSQREEVARQLTELRNKATQLLSQLGLTGVVANLWRPWPPARAWAGFSFRSPRSPWTPTRQEEAHDVA